MNGGLHIMSHLRFVCTVYDAHCAYDAHSVELRAWRCATCLLFMCINRLWNHDKFKVSSYFGGRKCNKVVIYGIRNVMLLGAIKILRCFTRVQYVVGCISGAFLMSTTCNWHILNLFHPLHELIVHFISIRSVSNCFHSGAFKLSNRFVILYNIFRFAFIPPMDIYNCINVPTTTRKTFGFVGNTKIERSFTYCDWLTHLEKAEPFNLIVFNRWMV